MSNTIIKDRSEIPVLILAGGLGTRLSEETGLKPKPMVEIGYKPILWHIMRYYASYGFREFVICAGYLSWMIKEYLYRLHWSDTNVVFKYDDEKYLKTTKGIYSEWNIHVIDTGENAMTGYRVIQALENLGIKDDDTFALTYGDGLSNVNLDEELELHYKNGKIGTILGARPRARFGILKVDQNNIVEEFKEKPQTEHDFINGGFFFFQGKFRNYLEKNQDCVLERKPLEKLASDGELVMFKHYGFWQCMDTLRDKKMLQEEWDREDCKWRIWKKKIF